MEVPEQNTDIHTVRSDQTASIESVLQQLKQENETKGSDFLAETSVPQRQNPESSNSS